MWLIKLLIKYAFNREEVDILMINLFVMQITLGWLKLEDIPEIFRPRVEALLEASGYFELKGE